MNYRNLAFFVGATLLAGALSISAADAQGRGNGQGQQQSQGRGQAGTQQQPGRSIGPQQQGERSRRNAVTPQQAEIREQIRTRDIYGRDLMSTAERRAYRDRVNAATSDRQWAQIREQHINEMQQRAGSQGQSLERPVYGQHMLTQQELERHRERLEAAQSASDRTRIRSEHQQMIIERARLLGVDPPALTE